MPLGLANLIEALPAEHRGWAIGVLATGTTVVTAAAPLVMALLLEAASWRWLFLPNVPITALVVVLALRSVAETYGARGQDLDVPGVLLLSSGLTLVVFGCERSGRSGLLDATTLALEATGLVVLTAFGFVETRVREPLLDPRLLTKPSVWA